MYKFTCRNCGTTFSSSKRHAKCPHCHLVAECEYDSSYNHSSYSHSHYSHDDDDYSFSTHSSYDHSLYSHDDDYSFSPGSSSFDSFGGGFSDGGGSSGDW